MAGDAENNEVAGQAKSEDFVDEPLQLAESRIWRRKLDGDSR